MRKKTWIWLLLTAVAVGLRLGVSGVLQFQGGARAETWGALVCPPPPPPHHNPPQPEIIAAGHPRKIVPPHRIPFLGGRERLQHLRFNTGYRHLLRP